MSDKPDYVKCVLTPTDFPKTYTPTIKQLGEPNPIVKKTASGSFNMPHEVDMVERHGGDWVRVDDLFQRKKPGAMTWCGRESDAFEWAFGDIDHALRSAEDKDRLLICKDCVKAIHEAMEGHSG